MRIAFVTYEFGEYSLQQAIAMAAQHEVLLVIPRDELTELDDLQQLAREADRLQLFDFDPPRLRQPVQQLMSIRRIVQGIDAFRPDVIHFQHGHLWFNLALPWLSRYPLVVTIHNPRHHVGDRASRKTPQFIMDFGFRRAAHVIVHGENLVPLVTTDIGIAPQRVHVVPHVAIGAASTSARECEEPDTILFFGRIWEYKGLDYLIRAEPAIAQAVPGVRTVIAGEGEDFGRYQALMQQPERFEVHNRRVSDAERSELFQRAAVVVLPYVEATQSGVVPVAYAHQKPVVATRVGGLPECVAHGETGLLVPPRNEQALARAIVDLLTDEPRRHQMGIAGSRKLSTECSPAAVAAQNVQVYRQAVADSGDRSSRIDKRTITHHACAHDHS